jgi:pimeloyl-ACP methyl ester carboxylesterase
VNLAMRQTFAAMAGRPNFSRIELPKAGHCANLDVPDEWRAALSGFWSGRQ